MKELFSALQDALLKNTPAVTVLIIGAAGATPRSPGALMLVQENKPNLGTVGGGQAEYDAAQKARELLLPGSPAVEIATYECLSAEELSRMGREYGGEVTLLFLRWDLPELALTQEISAVLGKNEDSSLQITYDLLGWQGQVVAALPQAATPNRFYLKLCEAGLCYIFGGGHVSRALAPLLATVGVSCVVLDERPEYASFEAFPTAVNVQSGSLPELAASLSLRRGDSVIIMTRGHQGDYEVLTTTLRSPVWYLGMVGSHRKMEATFSQLRADGFDEAALRRIVTPIGLSIDAETPEEIAVSIAAQMIERRAAYRRSSLSNS